MSNGSFEHGRAGWYVSSAPDPGPSSYKGRAGSKAARLTNRRSGPAVLNSRSNVARSAKAGQRYTDLGAGALQPARRPWPHGAA